VTHAETRAEAIEAQARALDSFVIDGIRHNIPFLASLHQHPRWRSGNISTGFIAEEYPDGFAPLEAKGNDAFIIAAVAAAVDHVLNERKRKISGQLKHGNAVEFDRDRSVLLGKSRLDIHIEPGKDNAGNPTLVVSFDKGPTHVLASDWVPGVAVWQGTVDGEKKAVQVRAIPNGFQLSHRGVTVDARVYTRREAELAALMPEKKAADTSKTLLCPMPGLVKAIYVTVGQEVRAGEPLCMVEAMKMENVLRAEKDVKVKTLKAKEGDSLAVDEVIIEFE
jgi:propionyl-CoA carboxylase alpha chain